MPLSFVFSLFLSLTFCLTNFLLASCPVSFLYPDAAVPFYNRERGNSRCQRFVCEALRTRKMMEPFNLDPHCCFGVSWMFL